MWLNWPHYPVGLLESCTQFPAVIIFVLCYLLLCTVGILTLNSGHCYIKMTQKRNSFVSLLLFAATSLIICNKRSMTSLNSQEKGMAIWICCLLPVMWWLCGWPWSSLRHKRVGRGEADALVFKSQIGGRADWCKNNTVFREIINK